MNNHELIALNAALTKDRESLSSAIARSSKAQSLVADISNVMHKHTLTIGLGSLHDHLKTARLWAESDYATIEKHIASLQLGIAALETAIREEEKALAFRSE